MILTLLLTLDGQASALWLAGSRRAPCYGARVWAHWPHLTDQRAREVAAHRLHHCFSLAPPAIWSMERLRPKPLKGGERLLLPHHGILEGLSLRLVLQHSPHPDPQEAESYHFYARKPYRAISLSSRGSCKDPSSWGSCREANDA